MAIEGTEQGRHGSIRFNKSQKKKTRERELFVLINELKLKKKEQKNRENMKNILILIQLTNLVIPQDVPQEEVESNSIFSIIFVAKN